MSESEETHGPDPRSHIDCCDPCLHVRGGGNLYIRTLLEHIPGGSPNPVAECCRCIPRAIMFRFTPDDYAANCCYPQSHLVHPVLENVGGWLKAVYEASVFGLTFELSLGRFSLHLDDYGHEAPSASDFDPYGYCDESDPYAIGYCAWRLRVYDGATLIYTETWPIEEYGAYDYEPAGSDCLTPPAVEYGPISWPPGCDEYSDGGYVTFEAISNDKLAYLPVDHVIDEYSLIDLCPSDCGGETPDCLAVQDDNAIREYVQIGDIGGFPAYQYGTNTIQWDSYEGLWVLLDAGSAELARGGTDPACPLGIWTPSDAYDYDVFCVSLCHNPYDAYNETDVSFVCGQCSQVGRTVCVSGNWREDGWEFLEFTWTKRLVNVGTYPDDYQTIEQGWSCTNPETDATEYLWLVDADTGCQLETEFSVNNFSPITITTGCSCDLFQQSHAQPWPGNVFWYSVHSGFCSEFGFYCGSCRCVPVRLCLLYVLDGSATANVELLWNADLKQWGDDYSDEITVHLEAGAYGDCELVVYYQGAPLYLWVPVDDTPASSEVYEQAVSIYDCQKEIWTAHTDEEFDHPLGLPEKEGVRLAHRLKCRKPYADWIGISHEGFLTKYGSFLYLHANSAQDQGCVMVACDSFFRTACPEACVDQPQSLNATLMLRTDDYFTGYGEVWFIEAELHLVVQYQGAGFPTFFCAYVGTAVVECEINGETVYEAWTIRSQERGFSFHVKYWAVDGGEIVPRQHIKVFSGVAEQVSCNPIYAETHWEDVGEDPWEMTPGLMCTDGKPEDDRPGECKLIVTK